MPSPLLLPPMSPRLRVASIDRAQFHVPFSDGYIEPLTGQSTAFSRTSAAPMLDVAGRTVNAAMHAPRFGCYATAGRPGLVMGLGDGGDIHTDALAYGGMVQALRTWTALIDTTEIGGVAASSGTIKLIRWGDASTTPRLQIDNTGNKWRALLTASGGAVSVVAAAAPTTGQRCLLRLVFEYDAVGTQARVTLGQSVAGAAEVTTAASSWQAIAAAWSSAVMTPGGVALLHEIRILEGVATLVELQS